MKKHKNFNTVYAYTYYIKHNKSGIKYYGVRWGNLSKNLTPNEDFLNIYFTSISSKKFLWFKKLLLANKNEFTYRIHYTFDNKDDAIEYERKITKKIYLKDSWANLCSGKAISLDHISKEDMSKRKKAGHLKRKGIKRNISSERKDNLRTHCSLYMQSSGENHPLFGTLMPEERKEKISDGLKSYFEKNPGINSGSKNGMYGKGNNYKAISPEGEEFVVDGIVPFCKERNIDPSSAIRCAQGKQKTAKKWKFFILPDQE